MSDDRTAADIFRDLRADLPTLGRASDMLDADRMVREGQDQARRQADDVDKLNNRKPGGR